MTHLVARVTQIPQRTEVPPTDWSPGIRVVEPCGQFYGHRCPLLRPLPTRRVGTRQSLMVDGYVPWVTLAYNLKVYTKVYNIYLGNCFALV